MKNIFTTLFTLLFVSVTLQAQLTFTEHNPIQSWKFFYQITQDDAGNIWASSEDGVLVKYDGTSWTVTEITDYTGEDLRAIAITDDNNIWVGTQDVGLLHYDGTTWTNYNTTNSMLGHNWVRDIKIASNGEVWVGHGAGLTIIDGTTWTSYTSSNSDLPDGKVSDIEFADNGDTWLANDNYVVRIEGSTWTSWKGEDVNTIWNTKFVDLGISSGGGIYAGTNKGLLVFDGSSWATTPYIEDFPNNDYDIQSLAVGQGDRVWFGTLSYGLKVHDIASNTLIGDFQNDGAAVPSGQLFTMFVSDNDAVWIAGAGGGISEITDIVAMIPLTLTSNVTHVLCHGESEGSITVTVNGGASPYTYTWNDANLSGEMVTNLSAGNYEVTITDNTSATITETFTINEPDMLDGTMFTTYETDNNQDGTAEITMVGGTTPYAYLWSDGQTTVTAINLSAGDYTVTITDANSCTFEKTATVDMVSAVEFISKGMNVIITPNPAQDFFFVKIEGVKTEGNLKLYSITGQLLLKQKITKGLQQKININNLKSGLYIIKLEDKNGVVYTEKIMIEE